MLARTFSFVQSLLSPRSKEKTALVDDRRLWQRYPTDLRGTLQLKSDPKGERQAVVVRNLSRGGANLILEKSIKNGKSIRLELLGSNGESRAMLARVIHTSELDDNEWSLGCVFVRELSGDDLQALGVPTDTPPDTEHRSWTCRPGEVQAKCRKYGLPAHVAKVMQVVDVSATSIGMMMPPSFTEGMLINVELSNKKGRRVCTILARITRALRHASGKNAVQCTFVRELSEKEIDSLL